MTSLALTLVDPTQVPISEANRLPVDSGQDQPLTEAQLAASGLATEAGQGAIFDKLSGDPATQTTLAAVLAKLTSDPATQTTLAAILAKLTSDPATQTTLAAILAKLTSDPATQTTLAALKTRADLLATETTALSEVAQSGLIYSRLGDMLTALQAIVIDADTIAIDADTINLNTDALENIMGQVRDRLKLGQSSNAASSGVALSTEQQAILSALGTETTSAAILAKLSSDPATQTTLAAILAKLSSDPATQTTLAAIATSLGAGLPSALVGGRLSVDVGVSALPAGAATSANQATTQGPLTPATATATKAEQIGATYNSTLPTFTNAQQGALQCGTRGSLNVSLFGADSVNAVSVGSTGDGQSFSSIQAMRVQAQSALFNGTTDDRQRTVVNGANTIGTGITAAGLMAQLDDTSPTAITENQFGNLRINSARALHVTVPEVIFAEDAAHTSGDKGVQVLGVRNSALANLTSNDGDYGAIALTSVGAAVTAAQAAAQTLADGASNTAAVPYYATTAGNTLGFTLNYSYVFNGTSWDRVRGTVDGAYSQGSVASGATDAGNPLKIGGKYNSTLPTFTNGQRGDLQIGTKGSLNISIFEKDSGNTNALGNPTDTQGSQLGLFVHGQNQISNGSSWDLQRSIVNATNSTGTGIAAAGLVAQLDDTSPTAITENQFGNVRMNSVRALYHESGPYLLGRVTADGQIKASAGFVHSVSIAPISATPTAGLLTIYDSTTETGTVVYSEWVAATTPGHTIVLDVPCGTGIYVGFDATLANVQCTVSYR